MAICNPDFNSSDFYSGDFQTTTIDFVFQTFIQDRLPDYFRRNDTYVDNNGDGLLMRYLSIFGDEIDQEIIPTIECYLNIIDAQNCDAQYLTHISDVLGNPPDIFGDDDKYRNLLSYICSVYKIKGTKKAYELFFSLLGFDIDLYEIPLNDSVLNYDSAGEYDTDMIYDQSKCSPCSFYDITFYPKDPSNYVFTADLIAKLRAAIKFNEPINAKLRHLTLGIRFNDSMGIKLNDSSNYVVDKVNIYDIGNEYDTTEEYDNLGNAISPNVFQTLMKVNRTNSGNNFNFTSSIVHNFTGNIDYSNTQLVITAYNASGNQTYQAVGTLEGPNYPGWNIDSIIIQNQHNIPNFNIIRLTGVIKLENGWQAQVNQLINNGLNNINLYFL